MAESGLRYDKMVEDALRGVVRDALAQTAREGLSGDHHFYITFRTRQAGVEIPMHVRARHPDEMTIVIQHQYWGLEVDEDGFEVTLSFSGKSERLCIPFAAVTGFADPSAKFGLQFQVEPAFEDLGEDDDLGDDELDDGRSVVEFVPDQGMLDEAKSSKSDGTGGSEAGKVVALDAFRKK